MTPPTDRSSPASCTWDPASTTSTGSSATAPASWRCQLVVRLVVRLVIALGEALAPE
ncbi:hypothetical protein N7U49_16500 [Streptomyces sp. AD2-2]|nr:hypothetical protein N7U49_16500 [Streptomyces sp. AD2-2]